MKSNKVIVKPQSKNIKKNVQKFENSNEVTETFLAGELKNRKITILPIAIGVCIALLIAGAYYFKGLAVAATVNGKPISRLSIIQKLEKQGGKGTLDNLITETLIQNEAQNKGVSISDQEIDDEIKKIEATVTQQGGTLDQALLQQGMTREMLKESIKTQKLVEKLLSDKLQISDEDVTTYLNENKTELPAGKEEEAKNDIREQLKQEKLQQEVGIWIEELKANANVKYYVNY